MTRLLSLEDPLAQLIAYVIWRLREMLPWNGPLGEAIEAEARASLDVERLAVVAAARALRERLTIDPGNVVYWAEWDTLDEALAAIEGSKE